MNLGVVPLLLLALLLCFGIGLATFVAHRRGRATTHGYAVERYPLTAYSTLIVLRREGREVVLVESSRTVSELSDKRSTVTPAPDVKTPSIVSLQPHPTSADRR